ncbi:MAG: preprotein translocase subunit SecD [Blastocatellia bacterium]|nr:preprotein translocase subunit SecD [Blastocatellia bacterium]
MQQRFTTAIVIVLFVSVGLACSMLRPKRALTWHVVLQVEAAGPDRDAVVKQTMAIIETRLDAFGLSSVEVKPQGDRILINLPDVADRERLKKLITAAGRLQLVAVTSPPSPAPVQTYTTKEEAVVSLGGTVPGNRRVLPFVEHDVAVAGKNGDAHPALNRWVVVESPPVVDGSDLRKASAIEGRIRSQDYIIQFTLKPAGAEKFGTWTAANINRYIGVAVNDEVKSIAYIKSQITDQGEISGRFTKQSAEDIAQGLNSGALPAPVRIVEEGSNK